MSEFQEQKTVIQFFKDNWDERSIRLSMNGVPRGSGVKAARMVAMMKSQGMIPHEADLFFAVARHGYHGLFIELKTKEGKATQGQMDYCEFQRYQGYRAAICYGAEEAIRLITEYMEGEC